MSKFEDDVTRNRANVNARWEKTKKCRMCGKRFQFKRKNQVYCADPCSSFLQRMEMKRERAEARALEVAQRNALGCSVKQCSKSIFARGLCQVHYGAEVKGDRSSNTCIGPMCDRPIQYKSTGLCNYHQRQFLKVKTIEKLKPLRVQRRKGEDLPPCSFESCERQSTGMKMMLCSAHYDQYRNGKELRPIRERLKQQSATCRVEGCDLKPKRKNLCGTHISRLERSGEEGLDLPIGYKGIPEFSARTKTREGYIFMWDRNRMKNVAEHRFVMEEFLGRQLENDENVHHINGDRADNRIENLELWSSSQPSGQRVQDKVAWAKEILKRYGKNY